MRRFSTWWRGDAGVGARGVRTPAHEARRRRRACTAVFQGPRAYGCCRGRCSGGGWLDGCPCPPASFWAACEHDLARDGVGVRSPGARGSLAASHQCVRGHLAHHGLHPHMGHGPCDGHDPAQLVVPGGVQPAQPALRARHGRHARDGVFARVREPAQTRGRGARQPVRKHPHGHRPGLFGRRGAACYAFCPAGRVDADVLQPLGRPRARCLFLPVLCGAAALLRRVCGGGRPAQLAQRLLLELCGAHRQQHRRHLRDVRVLLCVGRQPRLRQARAGCGNAFGRVCADGDAGACACQERRASQAVAHQPARPRPA